MLEDRMLIYRFNRGSEKAASAIYRKYKDDLFRLAVAMTGDIYTAEDVLSETFVSFLSLRGRFELKGSLKGYLSVALANKVRNIYRKNKIRQTVSLDSAAEASSPVASVDEAMIFDQEYKRLHLNLQQLPQLQREVIILRKVNGLSIKDIACQMGVSSNTVKSRYRYGIDKLCSLMVQQDSYDQKAEVTE